MWIDKRTEAFYMRGILLGVLLAFPGVALGEDSTKQAADTKAEGEQTQNAGSQSTASDVFNWMQRFGNRVGDNISEAASKSASAVKEAMSDKNPPPKAQSEETP